MNKVRRYGSFSTTLSKGIFLLILIGSSCKELPISKPIWLNKKDTIYLPSENLIFQTTNSPWESLLYTSIQPILLKNKFLLNKLWITLDKESGILEGLAHLVLKSKDSVFIYKVYLKNRGKISKIHKDYRSPKTNNPDSSLEQQKIIHEFDVYRNILPLNNDSAYFYENRSFLSPVTGIFRAVKSIPLTSYYVQPGSAIKIPYISKYNVHKKYYEIMVGPLVDKFNNKVADGTLIRYSYLLDGFTGIAESTLLNGYTKIRIPSEKDNLNRLIIKINETSSAKIRLNK